MNHLHQAIQRCPRVAVYGTLKHGHRNHHWLNGADMLGQDRLTGITLYDLGPYPGAKLTPSTGVTQYGDAWCYIYNPAVEQGSLMDSGEW